MHQYFLLDHPIKHKTIPWQQAVFDLIFYLVRFSARSLEGHVTARGRYLSQSHGQL